MLRACRYRIEKDHELVVLPDFLRMPLPCVDLPELVQGVISGILAHDSASLQESVSVWEEERIVSK